jgi:hypothetical protein
MHMQVLTVPPAKHAGFKLSERQQYRLDTTNMIIQSLAACGLRVFGSDAKAAHLEAKRLGGFWFVPAPEEASPVDMDCAVRGRDRLLPGFNGSYAEQRLLRCLVTYVTDGRSVQASMLAQALMADGNQYFDHVEDNFTAVISKYRFSRAFTKPTVINRKTGEVS